MHAIYIWVNLFSFLPTLLLSLHPDMKLYNTWKYIFQAIFISGLVFVLWDMLYTSLGVWGFNPDYLIGWYIGNLPIEEILFFICIPYACIFSYHCANTYIKKNYFRPFQRKISVGISLLLLVMSCFYVGNYYTLFAFLSASGLILFLEFVARATWLSRFYFVYILLQVPFLIVNGILTGTGLKAPIVWYNEAHIIGVRILTIPFEDIFYGMAMLLSSVMIYEYLLAKNEIKSNGL